MKKLILIVILFSVLCSLYSIAYAAIPHLIRYQGTAVDKDKTPLDGPYNITFRIYDAETTGTLLWEETQELVPISNGIFSILLGSITPLDLAFDKDYYLSVEINTDGEMLPRQRITSVAYAYRAEHAENVSGIPVSQTPTPNSLLPLDASGDLPISVIPQGSGSNLHADLLDDQHGSHYLNLQNHTGILSMQKGGTAASLTNDPGGIIYCGTANLKVLADGTQGKFLQSGGQGAPTWQKMNLQDNSQVTGVLPVELGGTGLAAAAKGDIIYASDINTWSKLPAGTEGQYLKTQGPGTDPMWDIPTAGLTLVASASPNAVAYAEVTGLDGDTDKFYAVYLRLVMTAVGWNDLELQLQFNNKTGGYMYDWSEYDRGGTFNMPSVSVATGIRSGNQFEWNWVAENDWTIEGWMYIFADDSNNGTHRYLRGNFNVFVVGGMESVEVFGNVYDSSSPNLTTLDFAVTASNNPTMTGDIYVYKYTLE